MNKIREARGAGETTIKNNDMNEAKEAHVTNETSIKIFMMPMNKTMLKNDSDAKK